MIFPTHAEEERVKNIISNYEKFDDLNNEDMFVIERMYDCLRQIDNLYMVLNDDEYSKKEILEEAYDLVVATVAETYVGLCEVNAEC